MYKNLTKTYKIGNFKLKNVPLLELENNQAHYYLSKQE